MKRELEERIQIIGHQLLAEMQSQSTTAGQGWINRLIVQLMADSQFRLQALRFVDTVPVLVDDIEMVRHFREYFSDMDEGQLPQLLAWGIRMMIAEAEEQHLATFSLILMDIDLFKEINDNHGHLLGDKLLQGVANLLTHHTKGKDTCARFGGDEFAILLPDRC
ncbi:MAG: diguanylate cyclase [Candidatus Thiodiazotropha sp. (ex Lucinoma kastoroae)]|nr:diguanylate cyclase [Candidatus Thiodiazotropha sp. (ex Lucinoma kastoroae)]